MPSMTINGHKHFYEDEGSGDVLVMIHGASGSALSFSEVIPELAKQFRVIAPDLRGMSRSEHVADMPPTAWNDDLAALLDSLGIGATHVYGVSLGARIAMRHTVLYPERVRTLALDAAIIANESAGNTALNARFGGQMAPEMVEQHKHYHGDDWQAVVANYGRIRNIAELQEFYNLRAEVDKITCPTLIVRGDTTDDFVHPLAHSIEIHTRLPHSWLWIAPNTAFSVLRAHPAEFRRVYGDFLEQSLTVGSGAGTG